MSAVWKRLKDVRLVAGVKEFARNNGIAYSVGLILIFVVFTALKLTLPLWFDGSYLDEYWHIVSGMHFLENGEFPRFYNNEPHYTRGSFITVITGVFVYLFGQTIFVPKMIPVLVGIADFVLLATLAHRVVRQRKYVLLLLAVYTTSPWVIFNHFYLRMYVFYELLLLANLVLAERLALAVEQNELGKAFVRLSWILGSCLFYFVLINDTGIYMPLLGVLVCLCYVYVLPLSGIDFRQFGRRRRLMKRFFGLHPIIKITLLVISGAALFVALDFEKKIAFLLHADIEWTSNKGWKYDSLFVERNLAFTALFLLAQVSVLHLKKTGQRMLALAGGAIFLVHYISSPELQITRGIVYFLPLYYLIAHMALGELRYVSNWILWAATSGLLLYTNYQNFPEHYFEGPRVPTEVHYIDYAKTYRAVKEHCNDALVVDATPSAFVAEFYDVQVDYVISATGHARRDTQFYQDPDTGQYRTVFADVPVITKMEEFHSLDKDVCMIVRHPSQRRFVHTRVLREFAREKPPLKFLHMELYRTTPRSAEGTERTLSLPSPPQ